MRRAAFFAVGLLAAATAARAAGPALLSYQGRLTDSTGNPIGQPTALRFTLFWGGTATEEPSTGVPVYRENVTVVPGADGVFVHLIGAGTPAANCDEDRNGTALEPCSLGSNDFPDGTTPVFLELTINPGVLDDVVLPRQQLVSVGYAMNAATVAGLSPAQLGQTLDASYDFGGPGAGRTITADAGEVRVAGPHGLRVDADLETHGLRRQKTYGGTVFSLEAGPGSVGPPAGDWFRVDTGFLDFSAANFPGGSGAGDTYRDNLLCVGFNNICSGGGRYNLGLHAFAAVMEADYFSDTTGTRLFEYNWNFTSAQGSGWRPFGMDIEIGIDGQSDGPARFMWRTTKPVSGNAATLSLAKGASAFYWRSSLNPLGHLTVYSEDAFDGDIPHGFYSSVNRTYVTEADQALHAAVAASMKMTASGVTTVRSPIVGSYGSVQVDNMAGAGFAAQVMGSLAEVSATGNGGGSQAGLVGVRAHIRPTGTNYALRKSAGLYVHPLDPPGAGTTIERYDGIWVDDRQSTAPGNALRIESQSSGVGDAGNVFFEGGGWGDGHLQLGSGHLWFSPAGYLKASASTPTGDGSGKPVFVPPVSGPSLGSAFWADAADPARNSGNELCAAVGLSCRTTFDVGATSEIACSDAGRTSGLFLALCY